MANGTGTDITVIEDKPHSKLSCSGSKRWMTCPASIQLYDKLNIQDTTSIYAAEGTVAHEIHEKCLLSSNNAGYFLGDTMEASGMKFTVDEDMVEAVQHSLDYIRDRVDYYEFIGYRVELLVEVWSSLDYLGVEGLNGGTSDVVLLCWAEDGSLYSLDIIDYKHGQGVAVEVEENSQAMLYALGVLHDDKILPHIKEEVEINITISQPRAWHPNGSIRTWPTSYNSLLHWQNNTMLSKAKLVWSDNPPIVASDEGCRFCGVAGQCPKLYEKAQEMAVLDFEDIDNVLPKIDTLTAEQKIFIMDHASMLRAFIVSVENQVKQEVDHGSSEYEGKYKLVKGVKRRKLTEDAFDKDVSPLYDYFEEGDLVKTEYKSISQIESDLKLIIKPKEIKLVMDEITTKPEGGLVIAPETDKRVTVQSSVINDFTDL